MQVYWLKVHLLSEATSIMNEKGGPAIRMDDLAAYKVKLLHGG